MQFLWNWRLSLLGIEVQRHRPDRSNGRRDRHSIESKLLMYVLILYCLYQNWEETFFVCARFLQFGQSNTLVKKSCRMTKSLKVSFRTETHYKIFWVRFHHVRSLALHWVPSHSIVPGVTGISVCKHLTYSVYRTTPQEALAWVSSWFFVSVTQ